MAKKLDIGALLGAEVSKLNTMQVQEIALALIDENPDNSYVQTDIDELAESIKVVGLQQPLVVCPAEGGRYTILAGHRRRNALALLETETAPCVVLAADLDPAIQTLVLHWTNTMARGGAGLTGNHVAGAAKEIEAALLDLKKREVVELPGKLREYVAGVLQVSESQLARAKAIDNNLIKAFKGDHKCYRLNDSVAYELSQCDETLQRELHGVYKDKLWRLDAKDVKAHKNATASGFAPLICPAEDGPEPCVGTDKRAAAVKRGECPGCCHGCDRSETCKWVCGKISKQRRVESETADRQAKADAANEAFRASEAGKAYAHAREVLEQYGYSAKNPPGDIHDYALSPLWSEHPAQTCMPRLETLSRAAELIGVSLQEMLFGNPEGAPLRALADGMARAVGAVTASDGSEGED